MDLAPILLFTYNRLELTRQTVAALKENYLAGESDLIIFSDGPKNAESVAGIQELRDYLKTIDGFRNVVLYESEKNKGLANSIIQGVSQEITKYDRVIVLEDDLITSKTFLSFVNQALEYYANHPKVFTVAGYTTVMSGMKDNDVYFTQRASSWGWATWREQWEKIDWTVPDYAEFTKDKEARRRFNRMGSDMAHMLDKQMTGRMDSWAIRWCYHQFKHSLYSVHPAVSKIINNGFREESTHTKDKYNRFKTELDNQLDTQYNFIDEVSLNKNFIRQFTQPYSIPARIKYKLLNALPRL